jgi:hypothetical protein
MNDWNTDVKNSLITLVSGGQASLDSGLVPIIVPFKTEISISGLAVAILISGSPTIVSGMFVVVTASSPAWIQPSSGFAVKMSGLNVTIQSGASLHIDSGLSVVINSGLHVILQSGTSVSINSGLGVVVNSGATINARESFSATTGNFFVIGTSATQFPNVYGVRHIIRATQSGLAYIAGANTVKSGIGLLICGDPTSDGSMLEVKAGNLNTLYGVSLASNTFTYLSFV